MYFERHYHEVERIKIDRWAMPFSQATLQTERLRLRPLSQGDAPAIQTIASLREISDTMISIPHPYPQGEAQRYMARQAAAFEAGQGITFVMEADARFCGIIEIRDIDREHEQAELSFWLAPAVWGCGYMSEALQTVIRFAYESLKLNRLYAYHMIRNPGSGRVLKKNGFIQEGVLRQRMRKWGVFEDVALWALLREDWGKRAA